MVIAGPNPTVDRVVALGTLVPGEILRAAGVKARVGGGGVNAARTVARLGQAATLVTVLPRGDERELARELRDEGLEVSWLSCRGRVRMATMVREGNGRLTVLNEPGESLDVREWEEFCRLALARLAPGRALLCTGSIPPGVPADGYARLARAARHLGCRCLVDAAGETLAATLEARESLLVPNLAEAEGVLHGRASQQVEPDDALERALEAANGLLALGAHAVVVTAGGAGAAYAEPGRGGGSGTVAAPAVTVASPVGAGDAFAAGLALRLEAGEPLERAVRFAVAVAADHVSGNYSKSGRFNSGFAAAGLEAAEERSAAG